MDSTDSSFVMVDHGNPSIAEDELQSLARYFPSLSKPSNFVYSKPALVDEIRVRRSQSPDGKLFIDELLSLVGVDGPNEYPPTSPNDLQSVIAKVLSSTSLSSLNMSSILYYLALTCSPSTASDFAQSRLLPPEFSLSIRAFHSLDTGDYALAIRLLSDPRIRQPDFVPKTIRLLAIAPGAEAEQRHRLVLSYWRLTGLSLSPEDRKIGVEDAELVVRALCDPKRRRGAGEAWDVAREWGDEEEVERLMRAILAASFGDNRTHLPAGHHLKSLLSFPFTPAELSLLTSFSLSPPTTLPLASRSLVVDWLLSLLISSSKPLEALVFYYKLQTNGKLEPSEERERLVKALEGTLTTSQRTTLSIEIATFSTSTAAPLEVDSPATTAGTGAGTKTASSLTQPAWAAPLPATPAATPSTPVRTLAAARQSKLPPPAAPTPKSTDLPLSASPFVRKDGGAGQGVLKALREQQHAGLQQKNAALLGSPARGSGTPGRGPSRTFALGSTSTFAESDTGSTRDDASVAAGTPVKAKPTLAGFGSVRQPQLSQPLLPSASTSSMMMDGIEMEEEGDDGEDENRAIEQDQVMLIPSPQNAIHPSLPPPSPPYRGTTKEEEFSRRIALDPAIQKTLLAASTAGSRRPQNEADASSSQAKTPKRIRGARQDSGETAQQTRSTGPEEPHRGDQKRRAIPGEHSHGEATIEGGDGEREREKPDQGRTVRLPPGAFPGMDEDQQTDGPTTTGRANSRASSAQPEMSEVSGARAAEGGRKSTTTTKRATQSGASRRSSRARSTSVAPHDDEDETEGRPGRAQPTPRRRSSRASSLQPPEMSEVAKTPVRRSSRLSNSANNGTTTSTRGGEASRRSTRRGQKAIEEEEEEQDTGADE
ncbi:hypothetical protein JCM11491_006431 [Sporobolomyces phaffii]